MNRYQISLIFLLILLGNGILTAQDATVQLITPDSVMAGEEFLISVKIVKGSNTDFAKLQLEIPPAFTVDSSKSDSARFSNSKSEAKYIWDRMPAKDTLNVDFKVTTDPAFSGSRGVNGIFAYISDEKKEKVQIPTKAIKIQQPTLASITVMQSTEIAKNPIKKEVSQNNTAVQKEVEYETTKEKEVAVEVIEPIKETLVKAEKKESEIAEESSEEIALTSTIEEKKEEKTSPAVTDQKKNITNKETQTTPPEKVISNSPIIEFRIQIVASAIKVDIEKLKSKYHISEKIQEEFHNGLWKYTTGSHSNYGSAKSKIPVYRDEKGVEGAFLTAYKNGQRITVRDAINQTK